MVLKPAICVPLDFISKFVQFFYHMVGKFIFLDTLDDVAMNGDTRKINSFGHI